MERLYLPQAYGFPERRSGKKAEPDRPEALAELVRGDGPGGFEARRALLLLFLALEAQERGLWKASPDDLNKVAWALQKNRPGVIQKVLQDHAETLLRLAPEPVRRAKKPEDALRNFLAEGTGYRARDLLGLLKRGLEKELGRKRPSNPVPPAPSCPRPLP